MKLLALAFIFISTSLVGEVVYNSNYNYWLYPLEGWELQPFEDDSLLSWFSGDKKIAFTINAWEGDRFSSTEEMLNELTSSIDGNGEFLPFLYYGGEAILGDVSFNHRGEKHRGWFLFINGVDKDYYLYSYSFARDYEEALPFIFSILDSFGVGDKGKFRSGPITAFYEEFGDKSSEEVVLDFYNYPIAVTIPSISIESRSNVIEREAKIMESYSYSPQLFYNAWKRYYRVIYRDNLQNMDLFLKAIAPYIDRSKYDSDYEFADAFIVWLQGMTYERRTNKSSDLISPVEAISKGIGDCDSKSLLLAHILNSYGIETLLLTSEKVKHAIGAIKCSGDGVTFDYNSNSYLGVELTTKVAPGELRDGFEDPSLWTIVQLEYDSDL